MRREAAHAIIAAKRKWAENNGGIIMEFIREERQTPIKDRCRVLVAGGGYAGVSAALAAARLPEPPRRWAATSLLWTLPPCRKRSARRACACISTSCNIGADKRT